MFHPTISSLPAQPWFERTLLRRVMADIILHGLPAEYDPLRLQADMDSGFDLSKFDQTARSMYISRRRAAGVQDDQGRHQKHRRDSGMVSASAPAARQGSTQVKCWVCGALGHRKSECCNTCDPRAQNDSRGQNNHQTQNNNHRRFGRKNQATRPTGTDGEVWCQLHSTLLNSNEECLAQAAGQRAVNRGPTQHGNSLLDRSSSFPLLGPNRIICRETTVWLRVVPPQHCKLMLLSKRRTRAALGIHLLLFQRSMTALT